MKFRTLLFLFFIISTLFIAIVLSMNAQEIYDKQLEKIRIMQLQKFNSKSYHRTRKAYIPKYSFSTAVVEVQKIVQEEALSFTNDKISSLMKIRLIKVVKILNHLKDSVALSIEVYGQKNLSKGASLKKTQQEADMLKEYFFKRTALPLIVAIGYGDTLSKQHQDIVLNLKRIKQ